MMSQKKSFVLRQDHLKKLLGNHYERLHILEEQQALLGLAVDPKIPIEIKQIKTKIKRLQVKLKRLRRSDDGEDFIPECPYPGMRPFKAEDARFFFGRKKEVNQIVQRLRNRRRLLVIGPSGCGKSSLIARCQRIV